MSIPLETSPFGDKVPCTHAVELGSNLTCNCHIKYAYGTPCTKDTCKDCNLYVPIQKFEDESLSHPLIRNEWVRKESSDDSGNYYWYVCSNCGALPPKNQYGHEILSRYCPSCGKYLYTEDEPVRTIPTGIYQHFKGKCYEVLGVAEHTETQELLVVYRALYEQYRMYTRPLDMFIEHVEDIKTGYRGPRFYPVDSLLG